MTVIIHRGWICKKQYNDNKAFAWVAYCENDPEWTASGSTLEEVKSEIDGKIEERQLKTA